MLPKSLLKLWLYLLASTLCVVSIEAGRSPRLHDSNQRWLKYRQDVVASNRDDGHTHHKMQNPKVGISRPVNDSIIYLCNEAGLNPQGISPCNSAADSRLSLCNTVLSGFFTNITVTDCSQEVTFSTDATYVLATATGPAAKAGIQACQVTSGSPSVSSSSTPTEPPALRIHGTIVSTPRLYVQKIITYYVSPWQAVVASHPKDITVVICKYDEHNVPRCQSVKQVWVTYTKYVPVTKTRTIFIATSLSKVTLKTRYFLDLTNSTIASTPRHQPNTYPSRSPRAIYTLNRASIHKFRACSSVFCSAKAFR